MPLPLGHAAVGLAAYEMCSDKKSTASWWKLFVLVAILANLPDIDVLIGLLCKGNGWAFHRGPTHSLVFALCAGFLASIAWRAWSQVPKVSFMSCFLVVQSHVLADLFFGSSRTSLFWPFEVSWAGGYIGWGGVIDSVFLDSFDDAEMIVMGVVLAIAIRFIRRYPENLRSITSTLFPHER